MTISRILKISRPRFWLYEAGTFSIGVLFGSYVLGISLLDTFLNINVLIFLFYFLIPANILIYGVNDIFDYETDIKNPKKVMYEALVNPSEHKYLWISISVANLPFIIYSFALNLRLGLFLLMFVFFAFFYSSYPIRAKIRPMLDAFFSASHYVWTAFFGYYLIGGTRFSIVGLLAGLFWAMAMHAYSAVPDIDADRESGIATVATFLNKNITIYLCILLYLSSFLLAIRYSILNDVILAFFALFYLLLMIKSLKADENKLFRIYKVFPYLNAIFGAFIWWSMALAL